jgi:TetR/AcrR family transcriptional regulator, transcriptional repressor for nem operon
MMCLTNGGNTYILTGMKNPERTRGIILKAAFQEVHRKGFKAASLSDILASTDLTKGALYHHFPNKSALGLALLDAIKERVVERWIEPLRTSSDPLSCLREITRNAVETMPQEEVELGCPLQNLAQEMSSLDESFRVKVAALYETWRAGIAEALAEGQKRGTVSRATDPDGAALFYISALSGCRGLAKNARSPEILRSCLQSLSHYLETLRA